MGEGNLSGENQEKNSTALWTVAVKVALAALLLLAALTSGSLALLTESAHAGLDLVSAISALVFVRISNREADWSHHYGHGKYENLSALIQVTLMLVACVWVLYESIQRLFFRPVEVVASGWAFLAMGGVIGADFFQLRRVDSAAQKHNSQALEANPLSYRNDLLGSAVTVFGLILVRVSQSSPSLHFLSYGDAIAAICLSILIAYFSFKLGRSAVEGLLDRAPDVSIPAIEQRVKSIPGVVGCHDVRARASGPDLFLDLHVNLDGDMPLRKVNELMRQIEETIQEQHPGIDVTIRPEPAEREAAGEPDGREKR